MRDRHKSRVRFHRLRSEADGAGCARAGPEDRDTLRAKVDGQDFEFGPGLTVLRALRAAGRDVPTLCSDERLKPCGNCRLCLVEVKGAGRLVTACNTPLADGMEIETQTPRLGRARRMMLKMLARGYPAEAVSLFPDKKFHRYLREYDVEADGNGEPEPNLLDVSHPYIRVDMSRCIDCRRCVRICEEVQGQFVWHVRGRGKETRILPGTGRTLLGSPCVACGACADTCPTGALEDRALLTLGAPTSWTRTTCPYCGTGCEMLVGARDGQVVSVKPVLDAPVSRGHLCVKGRYAFGFNSSPERVTGPMIRCGRGWERVSWGEALAFVSEKLRRAIAQHGPDAVGVLGSARATNEENYLAQKFARAVLGTNNVDCCARVCHAPTAAAMKLMLGTGAATNSFDCIERARTILVCGANPTENHAVVGARIKQAVLRGAKLIVIDPREIELARYADYHLRLRPGTNVPLLNALAAEMLREGYCDEEFIRRRVGEVEEFWEFVRGWTPERAADVCGVDARLIREAARLYATERPAMCFHGLGVTEHTQGTDGVCCLVNLALLTGNLGRPGAGVNPLRGQNNVQGAAHMGCDPALLTGSVAPEEGRGLCERVWRTSLPARHGLNLLEMMDAAAGGRLKALWAVGYDILLTNANAAATSDALRSLELVVVSDMFLNETAREFGTVFLPAASPFEKDGTYMNAERRVQRVRKVLEPAGESKPDWEIVCELARAMGRGELFNFSSPEEIWDEVRAVWPAGRGMTYARLEEGGLQWPCPDEDHPGTEVLHAESFSHEERASLRRVEYAPSGEKVDDEYPFLLNTGRTLYHFNAGTMTLRTPNAVLRPGDCLDISPADAARLGVRDGECVRVRSRYGEAELPAHITFSVRPGELFATFHTPAAFLNRVTGPRRDGRVETPEYKLTAVRVEKLVPPAQHVNELSARAGPESVPAQAARGVRPSCEQNPRPTNISRWRAPGGTSV